MKYINGSELVNKRFVRLDNGDLREVQKGIFVPNNGETYYYLKTNGEVVAAAYRDRHPSNKWIVKHHLVFKTQEECEDYRHFLETLDQYTFEPDWSDEEQEKWFLGFNHCDHKLVFIPCYYMQPQCVCFQSKERGEAFVDAVGEEAVERYMFDYWR